MPITRFSYFSVDVAGGIPIAESDPAPEEDSSTKIGSKIGFLPPIDLPEVIEVEEPPFNNPPQLTF